MFPGRDAIDDGFDGESARASNSSLYRFGEERSQRIWRGLIS
jgi:hypothetical protein